MTKELQTRPHRSSSRCEIKKENRNYTAVILNAFKGVSYPVVTNG